MPSLSPAKRRALERCLLSKKWSNWSTRAIARRIGVSYSTVGKYRLIFQREQSIVTFRHRSGKKTTMDASQLGENARRTNRQVCCPQCKVRFVVDNPKYRVQSLKKA